MCKYTNFFKFAHVICCDPKKENAMRLWSIHPRYLDAAGLTACWREGLLARAVLTGATVGYKNHPQLARFRTCSDPVMALDRYLAEILDEALRRGYRFDALKIGPCDRTLRLPVTDGQLAYEWRHLQNKLRVRAPHLYVGSDQLHVEPHPMFRVAVGEIEKWEKV